MGQLKIYGDTIYAAFSNWSTKIGEAHDELSQAAYYIGAANFAQAKLELDAAADAFYDMRGYTDSLAVNVQNALYRHRFLIVPF
ncbi:unnamed protein product [marine sediment metagenome]|uniref:Uncharacterized protein n=1 Tax=marine sediment metagenome TaxID=412755 RepID=X1Q959_9ZZZZ